MGRKNSSSTDYYTYEYTFIVYPNRSPGFQSLSNQYISVPNGASWTFGPDIVYDLDGDTLTKSIKVNNTSVPGWLTYNLTTFSFSIASTSASNIGIHTVQLFAKDTMNPQVSTSFTIAISNNKAPVKLIR